MLRSRQAPPAQSLGVFTGVVVIVSVGSLVVTVQAKVCLSLHAWPSDSHVLLQAPRWPCVRIASLPFFHAAALTRISQLLLPSPLRPRILRCTSGHRGPRRMLCPRPLGSGACGVAGLGMVLLGYETTHLCANPHSAAARTASVNFLDGTKIEQQRILLAVYPLLLVLAPRQGCHALMLFLTGFSTSFWHG